MATISKEAAEEIKSMLRKIFGGLTDDLEDAYKNLDAMKETAVEAPKIMEDSRWHDAFKESDGREAV